MDVKTVGRTDVFTDQTFPKWICLNIWVSGERPPEVAKKRKVYILSIFNLEIRSDHGNELFLASHDIE